MHCGSLVAIGETVDSPAENFSQQTGGGDAAGLKIHVERKSRFVILRKRENEEFQYSKYDMARPVAIKGRSYLTAAMMM